MSFDDHLKELKDFDIKKKAEYLSKQAIEITYLYDTLIYRLQTSMHYLDNPLTLLFNDLIDSYYLKIEPQRDELKTLQRDIKQFNRIYDVKKELNNCYYEEQDILKEIKKRLTKPKNNININKS